MSDDSCGGGAHRRRRRTASIAATCLVGIACLALSGCSRPRPNVVVLVLDTVRADRLSGDGYDRPTSPCIDEFAEDAVTFANAWSPSRWTPPSHASLFTGLRPLHHGSRPSRGTRMRDRTETMAMHLRRAGYRTGAFVANPALSFDPGLLRGFDTTESHFGKRDGPHVVHAPAGEVLDRVADWARRTAGADRDKPFFAFANLLDVHSPYRPPVAFQQRFVAPSVSDGEVAAARDMGSPEATRHVFGGPRVTSDRLALLSDLYDAEIAGADAAVGAFLEALDDAGVLDDTLVVIVSDHGEYLGEHEMLDHMQGVHRVVLRVPLIVRYPGRFQGGRRVADVVRLEDVLPTVLEVCGLAPATPCDGASLTGDLRGRVARAESRPVALFVNAAFRLVEPAVVRRHLRASRSVVSEGLHLIVHDDGPLESYELYDLVDDPRESRDISAARPRLVERLRLLLDED